MSESRMGGITDAWRVDGNLISELTNKPRDCEELPASCR